MARAIRSIVETIVARDLAPAAHKLEGRRMERHTCL